MTPEKTQNETPTRKSRGIGLIFTGLAAVCGMGVMVFKSIPAPGLKTDDAEVFPQNCVVTDKKAGDYYELGVYDFNRDALTLRTKAHGSDAIAESSWTGKISELPDGGGRKRAQDMFSKLPASVDCRPPKFSK